MNYSVWYADNDGQEHEVIMDTLYNAYEQAAFISNAFGAAIIEDDNGNQIANYVNGKFVN